jgi:Uma2 family endonuclease
MSRVMAVIAPKILAYEEYLKEGEANWRYDILDGVRVDMPSPNPRHQRIAQKITRLLEDYEPPHDVV